jgi:hypothetical protein
LQSFIDRFADVVFEIHTGTPEIASALRTVFPRLGCGGVAAPGCPDAVRLAVRSENAAGEMRYSLTIDGSVEAEDLTRDEAVALIEHQIIRNTVLQTSEYLAIHAAAVAGPRGALLLAGEGSSGKSSLCAELVARGFGFLSDELALVHLKRKAVRPFARAILLKPGGTGETAGWGRAAPTGRGAAPSVGDGRRYVDWESLRSGSTARECGVWKIALCRFEQGGATAISEVSSEDAFHALLGLTLNVHALGTSAACDALWDLTSSVPSHRVVFGSAGEGASVCV